VRGQAERQTRHVSPPCSHVVKATDNPPSPEKHVSPFLSLLPRLDSAANMPRQAHDSGDPVAQAADTARLCPPPLPSSPAVNRAAHPTCQAHDAPSPVA
jgi:hypothetical protein